MKKYFLVIIIVIFLGTIVFAQERVLLPQSITITKDTPENHKSIPLPGGYTYLIKATGTQGAGPENYNGADWFYCFECPGGPIKLAERMGSMGAPSRVKITLGEEEVFYTLRGTYGFRSIKPPEYRDDHTYEEERTLSAPTFLSAQGTLYYGGQLTLQVYALCKEEDKQKEGPCKKCAEKEEKKGYKCICKKKYTRDPSGNCALQRSDAQEKPKESFFAVCSNSEAGYPEHNVISCPSPTASTSTSNIVTGAFAALRKFLGLSNPTGHEIIESGSPCVSSLPSKKDIEDPPSLPELLKKIEIISSIKEYVSPIPDPSRGVKVIVKGTGIYKGREEEDITVDGAFCFNNKCINYNGNKPLATDILLINEKPLRSLAELTYNNNHEYTAYVQVPLSFSDEGSSISFSLLSGVLSLVGIMPPGVDGTYKEKQVAFTVEIYAVCKKGDKYMYRDTEGRGWKGRCIKRKD